MFVYGILKPILKSLTEQDSDLFHSKTDPTMLRVGTERYFPTLRDRLFAQQGLNLPLHLSSTRADGGPDLIYATGDFIPLEDRGSEALLHQYPLSWC